MLLYELAIELDIRSPDLVDAARELGLGELQAGSDIAAHEVAALRARFGGAAAAAPPPVPAAPAAAAPEAPASGSRFRRKGGTPSAPVAPSTPPSAPSGTPGGLGGPVAWEPPPPAPPTAPSALPPPAPFTPAQPAPTPPPTGSAPAWGAPTASPPPAAPAAPAWGAPAPAPAPASAAAPSAAPAWGAPVPGPSSAPGTPVAPEHWGPPPPPPGGRRGAAGASGPGGGIGRGQMALIGVAVVAVIGLFGFMVANSGTDEKRLQEIAETPPASEGVPTTGPDGKALTKKQLEDIAKYDAAVAANEERLCSELRVLSNLDIAMGSSIERAASLDDLKREVAEGTNETVAVYDKLIPLMADQAEGLRQLRQFTIDFSASVQAASGVEDLQARITTMTEQAASSGAGQAAVDLDRFATETCGVSTGNN